MGGKKKNGLSSQCHSGESQHVFVVGLKSSRWVCHNNSSAHASCDKTCRVRESSRSLSVMCLRPESQGVVLTTSQSVSNSPPHCKSWWLHAHRWRNDSWDIQGKVLQLGELSEDQTTLKSSGRKHICKYICMSTRAELCSYLLCWWFFPCVFMVGKPGWQPWGQRGAEELDKQRAHLWVGRLTARQPGSHHLRH